jgi:hypothetical protein
MKSSTLRKAYWMFYVLVFTAFWLCLYGDPQASIQYYYGIEKINSTILRPVLVHLIGGPLFGGMVAFAIYAFSQVRESKTQETQAKLQELLPGKPSLAIKIVLFTVLGLVFIAHSLLLICRFIDFIQFRTDHQPYLSILKSGHVFFMYYGALGYMIATWKRR